MTGHASKALSKPGMAYSAPMEIHVLLFAALRDSLAAERVTVRLQPGATARDLRAHLTEQHPRWRDLLAASRIAQGVEFVGEDEPLNPGDVALIPPVSGG